VFIRVNQRQKNEIGQFDLIMQNEPNSKTGKMNLILYNKTGYEKPSPFAPRKNEPKQTQFQNG